MKGKSSKWTSAIVNEQVWLGKPGIEFHVWSKYKKRRAQLGTLQVTVAGLRWLPHQGKQQVFRSWEKARDWFEQ